MKKIMIIRGAKILQAQNKLSERYFRMIRLQKKSLKIYTKKVMQIRTLTK
jgi:hypothetical protein